MNKKDLLKQLIKGPAKPTFGTNPLDPWSAKAGINEGILDRFLKSKGIDPRFVTTDQKISHSKSSDFLKWKRDHMYAESVEEIDEAKIKVNFKMPPESVADRLYRKQMELRKKSGLPDPEHYKKLSAQKQKELDDLRKEEVTSSTDKLKTDYDKVKGQTNNPFKKDVKLNVDYSKVVKKEDVELEEGLLDILKKPNKKQDTIHYIRVNNALKTTPSGKHIMKFPDRESAERHASEHKKMNPNHNVKVTTDRGEEDPTWHGGTKLRAYSYGMREDTYHDTAAATQMNYDMGNNSYDVEVKSQRSKSARIIKSIYKNKNMREDIYDHEKDDKMTQVMGKKPKTVKMDKNSIGDEPQALVVMTGGKTLTGEPRDTIEIDPLMRGRPSQSKPEKAEKK